MKFKKVQVKIIGSGTDEDPYRVNLPTCLLDPNTLEYDEKGKLTKKSGEAWVPEDEVDKSGKLDKNKIRAKYKDNPDWDREDVLDDV